MLWTTVALAYGALILFPVFWMATMVVNPTDVMFARPTVFLFEPTLAHFDYVIKEGFLHSLVTSFLLCTVSTLLVVLIGTPAAYAFARFEMKAKDDLFLFILATRMAPPVCLVIPFYLIFAKVGLLDTFLGLTIAYMTFNLSFYVWVLRSFCRDLPVELEEAAELEGWSKLRSFVASSFHCSATASSPPRSCASSSPVTSSCSRSCSAARRCRRCRWPFRS